MNWPDLPPWFEAALMGIVVIGFMAVVSGVERRSRRRAAESMQQRHDARDPLTDSQLVSEFGDDVPREVAERVLKVLAKVSRESYSPEEASFEPRRLRATDQLPDELGFWFDSLSLLQLDYELEKEFGVSWGGWGAKDYQAIAQGDSKAREPRMPTVGDVIQSVAAKLKAANRTIEPGVDYSPRRHKFFARIAAFFGRFQRPQ